MKRHNLFPILTLLALVLCAPLARANDGMFPPADAAKPFINYDGRGFLVNGKRTFIASGSLHYSRLPRALWHDVLLRMKRLGFNTVETYAFWNFHELEEGKWDFSGDKDLDAFLKEAKKVGLYAVVRVGPYVCAEWDSGGYPVWLRYKPDLRVRSDNPTFIAAMDEWLEHVMPIVTQNQIHKGGSVIMVQLENEHPLGWGTEMPNGYFRHLREKSLALGLEVPYFFSGLHHGSDPAGDKSWDSVGRTNPWYTTEFWPGWYDLYGPLSAERQRFFARGQAKIVAYGGNGYNFYMLYGGTNFAQWNNNEDASCYDYAGAIGQAGDLRPIAYQFKRVNWFAQSFADILENSVNADADMKTTWNDSDLHVTGRKSDVGNIAFLDNNSNKPIHTTALTIEPGEIAPVIENVPLLPGLTMTSGRAHIIGTTMQGDTLTLIIRGEPTEKGAERVQDKVILEFKLSAPAQNFTASVGAVGEWTTELAHPIAENKTDLKPGLETVFPTDDKALMYSMTVGGKRLRVLAINNELADRTWFVEVGGKNVIITGPDYVGDVEISSGKLRVNTERQPNNFFPTTVYGESDKPLAIVEVPRNPARMPDAPKLTDWKMRPADNAAQVKFDDSSWKADTNPMQMGMDGDPTPYAWYRSTYHAAQAGDVTIRFGNVGDSLSVFVNGKFVQVVKKPALSAKIPMQAGDNTLAVFAASYGRDKLFGYLGPLDTQDPKGISGPVVIPAPTTQSVSVTAWKWKPAAGGDAPAEFATEEITEANGWHDVKLGTDVFNKKRGAALYTTDLGVFPGAHRRITFTDVDDNATIYLNGKRWARHEGWGQPFSVSLDSRWNPNGPNLIHVRVENNDNTGGINGTVTLEATEGEDTPIVNWKLRGGWPYTPGENIAWQAVAPAENTPTLYHATFDCKQPPANGFQPVLRLDTKSISGGFVWLNGHNLGRYPEKTPAPGIWLPPCWLKSGKNDLVIFDEQGKSPENAAITIEDAASRIARVETAAVK